MAFFKDRIVPYAEAQVGVLTHALNYGTGVFAGIRGYFNREEGKLFVFRLFDHVRRLHESARLMRMGLALSEEATSRAIRPGHRCQQSSMERPARSETTRAFIPNGGARLPIHNSPGGILAFRKDAAPRKA